MRAAILVGALLCACGGAAAERRDRADELGGKPVNAVSVDGNHAFSDDAIVEVLQHHSPSGILGRHHAHYDRLALAVDRKRIVAFYHQRGYFSAKVTGVDVKARGGGVAIRFHVVEGSPSLVERIEVSGVPAKAPLSAGQLLADAGLTEGAPFLHEKYLEAKDRLKTRLVAAGYAHADVEGEVRVDRDRHRADVRLAVASGPLSRFGPARIEQIKKSARGTPKHDLPEDAIRARFAWKEGERFDPLKLEETALRLRELGYNSVTVDVARDGRSDVVTPVVRISTGKPHEVKVGGGALWANPRVQLRARADYTHHGFLQPLLTLRAEARVGAILLPRRQELIELKSSLQRNDFLVPLLQLTGTIAPFSIEDYEAYTTIGSGGGVLLARPFFRHKLRLSAGWKIKLYGINPRDMRIGEQLAVSSTQAVGFYEQSASLDLRDNRITPHKGLFAQVRLEEGSPYAAGQIRYLRATGDVRGYIPIGDRLVLAGRLRAGRLDPKSDEDPITRRFFGGGSNSHRGFGFRQLSPTVVNENGKRIPVGGDALLLASLESRFRLTTLWGLPLTSTLFFDAGDVTADPSEIDPGKLHHAAGLGFRLETPLGALRLDAAVRLNRLRVREADGRLNPNPGQRIAIHLAIGEAF